MDAAHLVRAVIPFANESISTPIGVVHDAFATTAGELPLLREVLLETLSEQYAGHPLEDLRRQLRENFKIWLPEPPKRGDLDVAEIMDAKYAFS